MEPIPYRIRIGVTGHRVLKNESAIKEKVVDAIKNELPKLFDKDSKTLLNKKLITPVTCSIVTALAEGSDRVVAETILEYDEKSIIEVFLPLTISDYKKTFKNPDDQTFTDLFDKARDIKQLRQIDLSNDPEICDLSTNSNNTTNINLARKEAFKRAGQHIVNHCDVLIAVWDGEKSKGIGGTFEVIEFAISKKRPVIIISSTAPNDIELKIGYGLNCDALKDIEQFNTNEIPADIMSLYTNNMYDKLFNNKEGETLAESSKELVKKMLLPYYVKISYLAKKYQKRYMPSGVFLFVCSAIAVLAVLIGVLHHPFMLIAFIIEFFCLLLILTIYLFAQRLRKNWLEYRFLTERMRTACYFAATNIEIPALVIPPYMGVVHNYNDWMVMVFNELWNRTPKMTGIKKDQLPDIKSFISDNWINDQKEHHSGKRTRLLFVNKRYVYFGWTIYFLALIASTIHIVQHISFETVFSHLFENILIFLAIALPAIGASVMGIHKHGEYERLESRSCSMTKAIEDISIDFQQVNTTDKFTELMYDFDKLVLLENQDWFTLMKMSKLEVCP